jgi:rhodanese-related sulfurtransferase
MPHCARSSRKCGGSRTRELADWLEDRHRQPPVLLDVRTLEEWNVSHLARARRIDPGQFR